VAVVVQGITLLLVAAAQVLPVAVQGITLLMALQVVEDIMQVVEALILWEERQESTLVAAVAVVDGITQEVLVVLES
jgi:hypothetical protein